MSKLKIEALEHDVIFAFAQLYEAEERAYTMKKRLTEAYMENDVSLKQEDADQMAEDLIE